MIQRRSLSMNIEATECVSSRRNFLNAKFTIKERKAAKRKEKSRVAAQIRRNKESQTLILLQNAIPLSLPNPSIMLEKSIVIRIAGQTLFLMNTLDQVLGMDGWLTIPLTSNNFLTFFMDSAGQIVYASPNIQLLLEQHHWSNIIGMSICDVVDFKGRWPTHGEVIRLKLISNSSIPSDSTSFSLSASSNISQIDYPGTNITSKLNLRKNSQAWNYNSSTCSLFNVWCCSSINYTNSKLRLLILQAVLIKSSVLNNINSSLEGLKQTVKSNLSVNSLERSISWPSMSTSIKLKLDDSQPSDVTPRCVYQQLISSAHDKYYNFKSASNEFCNLINETQKSLINLNLLDIIHLEDVIKVKSILDLIVKNNETHVWTPIYRFMSSDGSEYIVRTLAKQYCTTSSHSLILNHLIIKTSSMRNDVNSRNRYEFNRNINSCENIFPLKSEINKSKKTIKVEPFIISKKSENVNYLKRKLNDKRRTVSCSKYSGLMDGKLNDTVMISNLYSDNNQMTDSPSVPIHCDSKLRNIMLTRDPFISTSPKRMSSFYRKSNQLMLNSFNDIKVIKPKLNLNSKNDHSYNRSPSYSLESCVLTSPGSESNDVPLTDQFIWDVSTSFQEMTPINYFLDEQFQNDLELILPI